jgi:signal transduction histidine kinase
MMNWVIYPSIESFGDILHQHEESRRQWVADTSHELKTPLSCVTSTD